MKKILKFIFSRIFVCGLLIVVQIAVLVLIALYLTKFNFFVYVFFTILSVITILFVVSKKDNPIYKLAWIIPIALFPLLGWLIYLLGGRSNLSKRQKKRAEDIYEETKGLALQDPAVMEDIRRKSPLVCRQLSFIHNLTAMPVCRNTTTEYLSPGEAFFEKLCEELEKAEKFIFMEYFILQGGKMWDTVLEILARKAREGVEVKLIYDDMGSLFTLPSNYSKTLKQLGIEVYVFNSFRPSIDTFMNYRDHRKITVIDGNVGFTGGNNLADEYINAYKKHGYWKDSSLMLKGEAVWNLSILFLQMWQYQNKKTIDYNRYRPTKAFESDGYVLPFGDSPLDDKLTGELGYMHIIENAKQYITITTPYLILDNEMATALCSAAKSGIKVQIITPGIADKWYVHMVTRYNYTALIEAGVEIYEFTEGFIHAKTLTCDDEIAVVGTQNFDFRSFYLHFECGAYLYLSSTVASVRKDHLETLARSRRIKLEDCRNKSWFVRVLQVCLNLFAPLM